MFESFLLNLDIFTFLALIILPHLQLYLCMSQKIFLGKQTFMQNFILQFPLFWYKKATPQKIHRGNIRPL